MAFFSYENPIPMFLALVLIVTLIKILLGRMGFFKTRKSYLMPVVLAMAVVAIVYYPLLEFVGLASPLLVLIVLFLFATAALLFAAGVKEGMIKDMMKNIGFLKLVIYVLIVSSVVFAGSQIWGENLLEEPSVSVADAITFHEETQEINFAPLFSKQALGLIVLIIILGGVFLFVNMVK